VNVSGEPVAPERLARTDCAPDVVPSVHVIDADPSPAVVVLVLETEPPPSVTDHATVAPASGVPLRVTTTLSAVGSACPTTAVCASPLAAAFARLRPLFGDVESPPPHAEVLTVMPIPASNSPAANVRVARSSECIMVIVCVGSVVRRCSTHRCVAVPFDPGSRHFFATPDLRFATSTASPALVILTLENRPVPTAGTAAPDFTLPSTAGSDVTLSSFRDKSPVLLAFFPLAFTSTCTAEMCAFTDDYDQFHSMGVEILPYQRRRDGFAQGIQGEARHAR
jgi:hypothetical protein